MPDFNQKVTLDIIECAESTVPIINKTNFKYSFPPEIIKLIKNRRKVRKEIKEHKKTQNTDRNLKNEFNKLTSELEKKERRVSNKKMERIYRCTRKASVFE